MARRKHKKTFAKELSHQRDGLFIRFPLLYALFGTFGVVATYYGFQHLIERVPIFVRDPFLVLVIGISVLFLTGTLYKRLG